MAQHFLLTPAVTGTRRPRTGSSRRAGEGILGTPSKLIVAGGIAVVLLAVLFFFATLQAVQVLDQKSVDAERQRASIAVGLLQQSGTPVDSVMAGKLGRDYVLADSHLARPTDLASHEVSVPVVGTALVFAWTPRRLGSETVATVAPFRIVAAVLCIAGLMFVLNRLFRLALDLEARRKAARELATRDALTGLLNRRGFAEALEKGFETESSLALLYLDLDDFKQVNDRFGHATGDQLLLCVAQRLGHIAGPSDAVARLGGDEFVIIRSGVTSAAELSEFASLIHSRITLPYGLGDVEARVGLSIGIATRTAHMHDAQDLLASADAALYRAKDTEHVPFALAEELVEGLPRAA
jgi:diguanylate cyclase (GGDEF)-like protein